MLSSAHPFRKNFQGPVESFGSATFGVPLCLHFLLLAGCWDISLAKCPSRVVCVDLWLWRTVERANCAGIDGLCMREVQSRQVSLPSCAFAVYVVGKTSRTGFDFRCKQLWKRQRCLHPSIALETLLTPCSQRLIVLWCTVAQVPGDIQEPIAFIH